MKVPSYEARVLEVISGDDLILMVELGIDELFKRVRCRLKGVDAPDAFKQPDDSPAGIVRNDIRELTKGKQCRIDVHVQGKGGWHITLFIADLNVNEMLIGQGYVFEGTNR